MTGPRVVPLRKQPAPKTSGYAVGVTKLHHDWITATAAAVGVSRQRLLESILNRLVARGALGLPRKVKGKARR